MTFRFFQVLCLCCGSYYGSDTNCPNRGSSPHSFELSFKVAKHLHEQGIDLPLPADVRRALDELDKLPQS